MGSGSRNRLWKSSLLIDGFSRMVIERFYWLKSVIDDYDWPRADGQEL